MREFGAHSFRRSRKSQSSASNQVRMLSEVMAYGATFRSSIISVSLNLCALKPCWLLAFEVCMVVVGSSGMLSMVVATILRGVG